MINITVYQTKDVTGDNGKIIAYKGQDYSEEIRIIHPQFAGARYGIEYKYNQTIYTDWLSSNDIVALKIEDAGYLTCQFIAMDISTGNILFKSKPWQFLVEEVTMPEPSHYPCSNHHTKPYNRHCNCDNSDSNFNSYEAYYKLEQEIKNESDVRFNAIKTLSDDIIQIKKALNIDTLPTVVVNADELTADGKYITAVTSTNLPSNDESFYLVVSRYNNTISQTAYSTVNNLVYYRTGTKSDITVNWTEWSN